MANLILRGIRRAAIQGLNYTANRLTSGYGFDFEAFSAESKIYPLEGVQSVSLQGSMDSTVYSGTGHPYRVLTRINHLKGTLKAACVSNETKRKILPFEQTQSATSLVAQKLELRTVKFPSFRLAGVAQVMKTSNGESSGGLGSGHVFQLYNCTLTDYQVSYEDEQYTVFDGSFIAVPGYDSDSVLEIFQHQFHAIAAQDTLLRLVSSE